MESTRYQSVIVTFLSLIKIARSDTGFIHMSNGATSIEVCSEYNPSFAPYPVAIDNETKGTAVLNIYPNPGCDPPKDATSYKGKFVIMKRQKDCTFAERAKIVQKANGKGVIVVSDALITPGANDTELAEIEISLSIITNASYHKLTEMISESGIQNVFIKLYSPIPHFWDPNSIIMWILAVFTCSLGAWMQAGQYAAQAAAAQAPKPSGSEEMDKESGDDKKNELNITIVHALIFFGMCSVSILLMYFFYEYLVYVFIGIFCLASCFSTYDFLATIFEKSPCFTRHKIPPNRIPILRQRPPILSLMLFLICAGVAVFWAVKRKEPYAWILQDILGFTFCVNMIKQLRLPSFKICTVLLVLFFVYDVFYVFITPLFTKNKESIMVNIATGGGGKSSEELPMLFKLPRFRNSPYSKCGPTPYSLLGYGDVILPGLHVGFCAVWDFRISNTVRRHAYFIAGVIGYATGLVLTFVGMYLMGTGQPALLYLSPCCLLSTLIVALKRKELRAIWNGKVPLKAQGNSSSTEHECLLNKGEV